jgi:hypothetical protein
MPAAAARGTTPILIHIGHASAGALRTIGATANASKPNHEIANAAVNHSGSTRLAVRKTSGKLRMRISLAFERDVHLQTR